MTRNTSNERKHSTARVYRLRVEQLDHCWNSPEKLQTSTHLARSRSLIQNPKTYKKHCIQGRAEVYEFTGEGSLLLSKLAVYGGGPTFVYYASVPLSSSCL